MNGRFINFLLLLSVVLHSNGQQRKDVAPLLTTHWHQQSPYNDLCPLVDGGMRAVAGCVSTAASQIVFYWHRDNPTETLFDTPVYPYGIAPVTNSVPAGTPLRWNLIRDTYYGYETEDEREAVAVLVYVVGTSGWLSYGASTGGQINDMISPFDRQFRLAATYTKKSDFTQQQWEQLLYDELVSGRPVLYSGTSPEGGSHAVVVDGYDAQNNLFHFNFGWGGHEDGYYTVNDSTGMDGYCENQTCVYRIKPQQRNLSVSLESPVNFVQGQITETTLSITNNSTFNLQGLRVYMSQGFPDINKDNLLFSSDTVVCNDGKTIEIFAEICPPFGGSFCFLTVTDGSGEQVYTKVVSVEPQTSVDDISVSSDFSVQPVSGGVVIVSTRQTKVEIFNTHGVLCHQEIVDGRKQISLSPGIYIVGTQKIIIR